MNIVLLQTCLSNPEIDLLLKEFPQYFFLSLTKTDTHHLKKEYWSRIEILFGEHLTSQELMLAPQLRWIHTPADDTNGLCMHDIKNRGGIIVTCTNDPHIEEVGEYVLGGILTFAKHLIHWREAMQFPNLVPDCKWRDSIWKLKDRHLIQIGLDKVGTEIARRASEAGMTVYGVQEHRSFHPYCTKTIAKKDMHSVLPIADVTVLSLPKSKEYYGWFGKEELELLKDDSVLIVVGSNRVIDEHALADVASRGRLRGVMIDVYEETPILTNSPLWHVPNIIITPQVAHLPTSSEKPSFQTFRHNLRQFQHNNFNEMTNIVSKT